MNCNVASQMHLVNASKWAQEVAQTSPYPFGGIRVNFANAIPIVIPGPFMNAVINRDMLAFNVVVAIPLIGIDSGGRYSEFGDMVFQCFAISMFDHAQTNLTTMAANRAHHRWPIIVIGAMSTLFVSTSTRRILWISVLFALFPPHFETFHLFQLHHHLALDLIVRFVHWLEWRAAKSAPCRISFPVLSPNRLTIPLCISHVAVRSLALDVFVYGQILCLDRLYRADDIGDNDTLSNHYTWSSLRSTHCPYLPHSADTSIRCHENTSLPRLDSIRQHILPALESPFGYLTPCPSLQVLNP